MNVRESSENFMAALARMARSIPGVEGGHVFTTRGSTSCYATVLREDGSTVALGGLTGVEGACNGRELAAGAICFLADLFNVTLHADRSVVLRDAGGSSDDASWLSRFGFIPTSGQTEYLRLPMTLKNGGPGW